MTNIFNYQPFIQKEFANIRLLNQIFNSVFKNNQINFKIPIWLYFKQLMTLKQTFLKLFNKLRF
jgi:hypothetical protein